MRDDDQRDVQPAREVLHQFQDLRLDRHIERRCRLVGDDEFGVAGEPDGDHHALAHAPGELMRILLEPRLGLGNADQPQEFDGARPRLFLVHTEMDGKGLADLQADLEERIERGHRLLEDHGNVAAAHLPHRLIIEVEEAAAIEHDASTRMAGAARQQPHDGEGGHGFAGAGFADDGDGFPGFDAEAQPIDGVNGSA
jgi:hypothetical protein